MGTGSDGYQTRGCDHQTEEPAARPIDFQHVVRAHQGAREEVEASQLVYDQDRGRFGQDAEDSSYYCVIAGQ